MSCIVLLQHWVLCLRVFKVKRSRITDVEDRQEVDDGLFQLGEDRVRLQGLPVLCAATLFVTALKSGQPAAYTYSCCDTKRCCFRYMLEY